MISYNDRAYSKTPSEAHSSGRLALLKLRGREQLNTVSGRSVFITLQNEQLMSHFTNDTAPSEEVNSWMYGAFPPSPVVVMELIMHDILSWRALLKETLLQTSKVSSQESLTVFETGLRLHELMEDLTWFFYTGGDSHSETLTLYYEALSKPRSPTQRGFSMPAMAQPSQGNTPSQQVKVGPAENKQVPTPMTIEFEKKIYGSDLRDTLLKASCASAQLLCRAADIHLLQGLLKAIAHLRSVPLPTSFDTHDLPDLESTFNARVSNHTVAVAVQAPDAIEGIPDASGRFPILGTTYRAFLMVWPFRAALWAPQTPPKYKALLIERVKDLDRIHGIGLAQAIIDQAPHHPFSDGEELRDGVPAMETRGPLFMRKGHRKENPKPHSDLHTEEKHKSHSLGKEKGNNHGPRCLAEEMMGGEHLFCWCEVHSPEI